MIIIMTRARVCGTDYYYYYCRANVLPLITVWRERGNAVMVSEHVKRRLFAFSFRAFRFSARFATHRIARRTTTLARP